MTTNIKGYVNFHAHTSKGSPKDGMEQAVDLVKYTKKKGHSGCCITEHGSFCNSLELLDVAKKNDVKAAMGIEFYITDDLNVKGYYHITVIAKNEAGYRNISYLTSISTKKDGHYYYRPRITFDELFENSEGLVCTTGCYASPFSRMIANGEIDKANELMVKFKNHFKEDFYCEMHIHSLDSEWDNKQGCHLKLGKDKQLEVNTALIELANKNELKVLIAQDSHMTSPEIYDAQVIMMSLNQENEKSSDTTTKKKWHFDKAYCVMSVEEMRELSKKTNSWITDEQFATWCNNSVDLLERIDYSSLKFPFQLPKVKHEEHPFWNNELKVLNQIKDPNFISILEKSKTDKALLLTLKIIEANNRFQNTQIEIDRIVEEINVIQHNGYLPLLDYFLIIEDFVQFVKKNNSINSTGRGSGASSYVCYLLGLLETNPLEYPDLILFSRFLTLERILKGSLPDFDFDTEIQESLFAYLKEKYGESFVSRIGTYQNLKVKGAIKDCFRVLRPEIPHAVIQEICDTIGRTKQEQDEKELDYLNRCIEEDSKVSSFFHKYKKEHQTLVSMIGSTKGSGIHAGGVVISPVDIRRIMPLSWNEKENMNISQFEMKYVEQAGLIKYDILNINTLKDVRYAFNLIQKELGINLTIAKINKKDPAIFECFRKGLTESVFQFNSDISINILKKMKEIRSIVDLAIITAIGRPGPLKIGADVMFTDRANGLKQQTVKHPKIEKILKHTYGLIVFQENIQMISQEVAGFSKDKSVDLIKALSKKVLSLVQKFEDEFIKGCIENSNMNQEDAEELWQEILPFSEYGFNAAHSIAYAELSYICMYLKHYYPSQWMRSVLSHANKDDYKELTRFWGNRIKKPTINKSTDIWIEEKKGDDFEMYMSLNSINGVKDKATEEIIALRPFTSFDDFLNKIKEKKMDIKLDKKKKKEEGNDEKSENYPLNMGIIEKLILSGCLDELEKGDPFTVRRNMLIKLKTEGYKMLLTAKPNKEKQEEYDIELKELKTHRKGWYLSHELCAVNNSSFSFSTFYKTEISKHADILNADYVSLKSFKKLDENERVCVLGGIVSVEEKKSATGNRWLLITLFDGTEQINVNVFGRQLDADEKGINKLKMLKEFVPVFICGKINVYKDRKSLIYEDCIPLL